VKTTTLNLKSDETDERHSSNVAIQISLGKVHGKVDKSKFDEFFKGKFNGPPVEVSLDKLGATHEEILNHRMLKLERKNEELEKRISCLEEENKILQEHNKITDKVNDESKRPSCGM